MTGHMRNLNLKIVESMIDQIRYMMSILDVDKTAFDADLIKTFLTTLSITPSEFCYKFYNKTPENASLTAYSALINKDANGFDHTYSFEEFITYVCEQDGYVYPVRFVDSDGTLIYRLCEFPGTNEESVLANEFFTMLKNSSVEKFIVDKNLSKFVATETGDNHTYKITVKRTS